MRHPPLAQAALILALGNIGSRVLGLAREQVIAGLFGATAVTDAFRVSFRVPLALYDLLMGGMVSSALVPVFSGELAAERRSELGTLVGTLLNLVVVIMAGVVLALVAAAPFLVRALATGYPEEVRTLSVGLVRLLVPSLLFMGASGLFTAMLYAQHRFVLPAVAGMAYNAGIVLVALMLHQRFGVTSLVLGVLAGAGLQMLLQSQALRGISYRPRLSLRHPGVGQIARLYLPVALGLIVSTVGIAIDTNLASRTGEGNLAAMGFATTLVQFPLGLVATAVSSALLPSLSRHAQATDEAAAVSEPSSQLPGSDVPPGLAALQDASPEDATAMVEGTDTSDTVPSTAYKEALAQGLKLVLLTIIPATLGLLVLRKPLVQLLFQRGAFDALAAERTSAAFLAYSPGLPAAAIDQVLIYGFYARKRTLPPVLVGVMGVGVYVAVGLALLGPLGMPGLALANSAQWVSHMVVMWVLTHSSVGGLSGLGLLAAALRALLASGIMLGVLLAAGALISLETTVGTLALGASLTALLIAGALTYVGALALIGRNEVHFLADAFRARVRSGGSGG